ncbi:MAG: tetratricopeptide repeat protein, partial [Bacteroidetes bacterium]|nr:tetratricopeptide repeat protein [Bacteroidota bacterium]
MFFLFTGLSVVVKADPLADFNKAKEYYQKSDYENAARLYESIVKSGMVSAEVYYNLGNCYFKT